MTLAARSSRILFLAVPGLVAAISLAACSSSQPRRDPTGETFPAVSGTNLDGKAFSIPGDFAGEPVLLLVGYRQETQFDIDRWLLGLTMHFDGHERVADAANPGSSPKPPRLYEVPTIPGLAPSLFAGRIDEGMRSGIPSEDWGSVITVYGDGGAIAKFTGTENGLPGRVLLLDAQGKVVFFHDRGYSIGAMKKLLEALRALETHPAGSR